MSKRFGELLREQRKRSGFSPKVIARELAVSVKYLSELERGKRPPPAPENIRRAAALMRTNETSLQDLLRAAQAASASSGERSS